MSESTFVIRSGQHYVRRCGSSASSIYELTMWSSEATRFSAADAVAVVIGKPLLAPWEVVAAEDMP